MLCILMKLLSRASVKKKEEKKKRLRVSNFALLWVVFKLHHGSEGVKMKI